MARGSIRNIDLVAAVNAAYRVDLDEREWLVGIGEAVERMVGHGEGANLYLYQAHGNALKPGSLPVHTRNKNGQSAYFAYFRSRIGLSSFLNRVHPQMVDRTFLNPLGPGLMLHLSEKIALEQGHSEWVVALPTIARLLGFSDAWGMTVPDERGGGIAVSCPQSKPRKHPDCHYEAMRALMPSLQAAQRLRHHTSSIQRSSAVEAILLPDGKVESASGAARDREAQEHLGQVVRDFDRNRARHERGTWDGEAVWPGIVEGRWSLVERIERDGRRFIIAHANGSGAINPRRLNAREREVAERVAAGDMNKEVAAAVGCSKATAELLLASVLTKLGMTSRRELILDYRRAPLALAHKIGGLSADEPVVAIETDITLRFDVELTQAQHNIAELVAHGFSNAEIAAHRKTSVRTVANQVRQIFERCGVHSRAELLALALAEGVAV